MRYLLIILLFISILDTWAQDDLSFDKRYVECEDQWVSFKKSDDGSYMYGFIYIDEQAGLTFNLEGTFTVSKRGAFEPKKSETSIKLRLQPNKVLVAIIPETRFDELEITKEPEWLQNYKETDDTLKRMVRWGYFYNDWGESKKALTFLEPAYKVDPHLDGLEFELSFAYNALERWEDAISVLKDAIEFKPDECLYYKEIVYAYSGNKQLEKASDWANKGISVCSDNALKAEIAFNVAQQYYLIKDKDKFSEWSKITLKYAPKDSPIRPYIKQMKKELK